MPNVEDKESEVSLEELFKYPMLKIAILLCILALTLYVLFNGKRKLEPIPVIEPITNTSIDFANSVGELYFNNKDNKNLAEKIINQYLEGIRSKYNMPTHTFDDNFFNKLSVKTNTPLATIKNIFTEIKHVQQNDFITDPQLQNLYNQIKQQKS